MKTSIAFHSLCFFIAVLFTGCESNTYHSAQPSMNGRSQIGSVSSIEIIAINSRNSGGGAVLGAVLGGVIGHQMGGGRGRDVTTGLGAIGGAVAGNQIEKRNKHDDEIYRVIVNFDNGRTQQFDYQQIDDLRVGDRVRVERGSLYQL